MTPCTTTLTFHPHYVPFSFMSNVLTFTDAEHAHLSEAAGLDMVLAPSTIAEMGRTYQRTACSARQSIALAAKLRRKRRGMRRRSNAWPSARRC